MKSYVFAFYKFWTYQTFHGLNFTTRPQNNVFIALKQSLIQAQHVFLQAELVDWGKDILKDGYIST